MTCLCALCCPLRRITNSAVHAQWCVVFAQLMMGGKNQGIHGFLVRCVVLLRVNFSNMLVTC